MVEIYDSVTAFIDNMAYLMTIADKDTMTLKDALNEPDAEEFLKAMVKEVDDHVRREHWRIVSIGEMLLASGYKEKPIMGVWSMKRKHNPLGKYKARLCAHGRQTIKGIHYENTYAPVVTWTTIRFLLT